MFAKLRQMLVMMILLGLLALTATPEIVNAKGDQPPTLAHLLF